MSKNMDIGKFIAYHRVKSGFKSQRQLADKTGISSATISRIESGIQRPNVETLKVLSQHLHTTSLVELMVVCGYWDEDELLEPIDFNNGTETTTAGEEAISVPIEELANHVLTYKGVKLTDAQKKRLQRILLAALAEDEQ